MFDGLLKTLEGYGQNIVQGAEGAVHGLEAWLQPHNPVDGQPMPQPQQAPQLGQPQPQENPLLSVLGINTGNAIGDALNSWVAKTPQLIQTDITDPIQHWISAHTPTEAGIGQFGGKLANDAVGIAGNFASIPGTVAQVAQNPTQAVPNVIDSIVNNYKQDFGYDPQTNQWSLQNAGSNLYNRPLSTILDLLPAAGLLGKAGALGKAADLGKAGEVADTADAGTVADTATADMPGLTPQERLTSLLHYPQQLQERGYSPEQIDQISAPMARDLLANDVSPEDFLKNDAHAVQTATAQSELAKTNSFNLLGNMPQNIKDMFSNWTNSRSAAPIEGMQQGQNFSQYDALGKDGLTQFQHDPSQFPDVKNYFDTTFAELKNAGVDMGYKGSYLPQLWVQDPEQVAQVFGKALSKNAPFTFQSVFKDYQQGIQAGLTPRYNTLGDLAQYYEKTANKLLADRTFFDSLKADSLIQPAGQAEQGWQQLGQGFPKYETQLADGTNYAGVYAAPPQLAQAINNYLTHPDDMLSTIANASSRAKNIVLGSGIPGTGLNFHGVTTLARQTLLSNNPISGFFKGIGYLARPTAAQNFIDANLKNLSFAVHSGLNVSIEDHNFVEQTAAKAGLLQKAANAQRRFFEYPLFNQVLPALKLQHFNAIYENLKPQLGDEQAAKTAAQTVNTVFGGNNLDVLARSKVTQNVLKALFFAPDHLESTVRTGKGIIEAVASPLDPAGKAYRTFARNALMGYLSMNIANYLASGHFAINNAAGHNFEIEAGTTGDGQKRYINPWGSAIDMFKVPEDVLAGLLGNNTAVVARTVQNRLSPFIGMVSHQATNTNYLGQHLYKTDASTPEQMLGRATDAVQTVLPPYVTNAVKYATGQEAGEPALAASLQAPIRYSSGATNKTEKTAVDAMQAAGASGSQIYNQLQTLKQQATNTSKGQSTITPTSNTGDVVIDAYNKSKNKSDTLSEAEKIYTNQNLTPKQQDAAVTALGITPYDAHIEMLKKLPEGQKADTVKQLLGTSGQGYMTTFTDLASQGIITTGLTAKWVKDGTLTVATRKALDALIGQINGTSTATGTGSGSRSGSRSGRYSATYGRMPMANPTMPTVQLPATPAFAAPTIQLLKAPKLQALSTAKTTSALDQSLSQVAKYQNLSPNQNTKLDYQKPTFTIPVPKVGGAAL